MDLKLTKERMANFWEYGKLRLLAALLIALAAFYALFMVTRPRVAPGKRFDIIHGGVYLEEGLAAWSDELLNGVLTDTQKQVNMEGLSLDDYDAYSAQMVLTGRLVAQDGDVFIIPYSVYMALGRGDNLVNLEEPIPGDPAGESVLDKLTLPEGMDPEACRLMVTATGSDGNEVITQEICGLNAAKLQGLMEIGVVPNNYVICIPDYKGKDMDNVVRFLNWLLTEKVEYHEIAKVE